MKRASKSRIYKRTYWLAWGHDLMSVRYLPSLVSKSRSPRSRTRQKFLNKLCGMIGSCRVSFKATYWHKNQVAAQNTGHIMHGKRGPVNIFAILGGQWRDSSRTLGGVLKISWSSRIRFSDPPTRKTPSTSTPFCFRNKPVLATRAGT